MYSLGPKRAWGHPTALPPWVGLVLGVAVAAIIASLAADIITPLIAAIFGQSDFGSLSITLNDSRILYGSFPIAMFLFFVVEPRNVTGARSEPDQEGSVEEPAGYP